MGRGGYENTGGGDADSWRVHCWANMVPRSSDGAEDSDETRRSAGEACVCALRSVALVRGLLERVLDGLALGGSSAGDCSGEAEDAARLSRSSRRRLSFLPIEC